jgi:hypothetical protein
VFVNESGRHIAMDRLRARAPTGERAYGKVGRNGGKKNLMTLLASMSLSGMGEAMYVEGAIDALAFEIYVEHFLAARLEEGQVVVVLDKLKAHKPKRVREL